jgi:transcriptional antiterminator RfaH
LKAVPVLPSEPSWFPEHLFEEGTPDALARSWWVLHTRPRQEKSLARQLHSASVPYYLPLAPRRSRIRGRIITSHNPLFAGYLFLLAQAEERITALATSRVVNSIRVLDQQRLWDDLRQVHRLIATGEPVTPEERLAPGMFVEVRDGPLAGLTGKILRAASGRRFVVEIDFIQRGASVTLDDFVLVRCPDSGAEGPAAGFDR